MSVTQVRVRIGCAADLARVVALERSISDAPHWSEAEYASIVAGDAAHGAVSRRLFVAEGDKVLVGFAVGKMLVTGDDCVAELESVAVDASARRVGTGRALCESVVAWCRSFGALQLELEVRAGSKAAKGLYRGMGFEVIGRRAAYYRDPIEDAVLMRLKLEREE